MSVVRARPAVPTPHSGGGVLNGERSVGRSRPTNGKNVVLPEFQKILVGQQNAEKATDAILKGLDAAIK